MSTHGRGDRPRRPVVTNIDITLADTEYSHQLAKYTKKYLMHTRDESAFRLAFEADHVATPTEPYFTVLANTRYWEDHIDTYVVNAEWNGTLYFASDATDKVMEIIEWS